MKRTYWREHPAQPGRRHAFRRDDGAYAFTSLCGRYVMDDPREESGRRLRPAIELRCAACDMLESGPAGNLPADK